MKLFSTSAVETGLQQKNLRKEKSMIGWIEQPSIVPFLAALPGDLKRLFRDTVVERMILKTKQRDGSYFETFRRINVYAEK